MKQSVPTLTPLLRSDAQGRLLATLFLRPDEEFSINALGREVSVSGVTALREVNRLVNANFLTERRSGRNRYVRANEAHPLFAPLRQIVEWGYGPLVALPPLIREMEGVEEAYVYGSWAARLNGVEGPPPGDIDVLLIGTVDEAEVYDFEYSARKLLRRDVNVEAMSAARWADDGDPFVRTVQSRPVVRLLS
jgi:hypothetical protein